MVTIRPATGVKIATQVKKVGEEVKATLPSVEKEGTKLPSFQAPIIKNTRFDKVIVEGNIKERIEKLNILDGDKELDKLLKQYRADVDKCKLSSSYKEYRRSVNLVEKKWHSLFEKIEDEYDVTVADEAYQDYLKSGKKSRPVGELWKDLGI